MLTLDNTLPADEALHTTESKALPWIVVLSAGLFFFYEFIQMNMMNSLNTYLVKEYSLTATQVGNFSAYYFHANLIFLFAAGSLLDRFSTRKIILSAMVVCVLGTFLFGMSSSVFLSSTCRFFTGIGSAFCFLSCVRLASRWFPPSRMALATGCVVTMAMLGGFIAQTPLTLLCQAIGWKNAIFLDGSLGIIITFLVWRFVQDFPASQEAHHASEQQALQQMGTFKALRLVFFKKQNWLAGIYTSFLNLPISLLGALWGNTYLQEVNHLSATEASGVTSMIFAGTVVGGPLAGWLSDKLGVRRLPMMLGAVLAIGLIYLIISTPDLSASTLRMLFLLLGFISSTQVISYPTIAESNPKILTASAVSIVSISAIGGYAVFQPLFGRLMDLHWSGHLVNHLRVYSAGDYRFAIKIMPIAFFIGLIAAYLLKETHCKPVEK